MRWRWAAIRSRGLDGTWVLGVERGGYLEWPCRDDGLRCLGPGSEHRVANLMGLIAASCARRWLVAAVALGELAACVIEMMQCGRVNVGCRGNHWSWAVPRVLPESVLDLERRKYRCVV